jgi:hypothetical protein
MAQGYGDIAVGEVRSYRFDKILGGLRENTNTTGKDAMIYGRYTTNTWVATLLTHAKYTSIHITHFNLIVISDRSSRISSKRPY